MQMPSAKATRIHPINLLLLSLGGLCTFFLGSLFYLGSQEQTQALVQNKRLLLYFGQRFLGFTIWGLGLTVAITLLNVLVVAWQPRPKWAETKRVFWLALVVQVSCALAGSLFFTLSLLRPAE